MGSSFERLGECVSGQWETGSPLIEGGSERCMLVCSGGKKERSRRSVHGTGQAVTSCSLPLPLKISCTIAPAMVARSCQHL